MIYLAVGDDLSRIGGYLIHVGSELADVSHHIYLILVAIFPTLLMIYLTLVMICAGLFVRASRVMWEVFFAAWIMLYTYCEAKYSEEISGQYDGGIESQLQDKTRYVCYRGKSEQQP